MKPKGLVRMKIYLYTMQNHTWIFSPCTFANNKWDEQLTVCYCANSLARAVEALGCYFQSMSPSRRWQKNLKQQQQKEAKPRVSCFFAFHKALKSFSHLFLIRDESWHSQELFAENDRGDCRMRNLPWGGERGSQPSWELQFFVYNCKVHFHWLEREL